MLQKKFILFFALFSIAIHGQTYIKGNMITTLVLVPNIGIETPIADKWTFQADFAASFWKSINHGPFQFITLTPEIRYHFKENANGFYVGGHVGGAVFKLQKWDYANTNFYQKGLNYFVGATVGYQRKISEKMALDIFLGGGNQQAFYKGYDFTTNQRVDSATKYNKSGEWLPYRGGIMICYKIN